MGGPGGFEEPKSVPVASHEPALTESAREGSLGDSIGGAPGLAHGASLGGGWGVLRDPKASQWLSMSQLRRSHPERVLSNKH